MGGSPGAHFLWDEPQTAHDVVPRTRVSQADTTTGLHLQPHVRNSVDSGPVGHKVQFSDRACSAPSLCKKSTSKQDRGHYRAWATRNRLQPLRWSSCQPKECTVPYPLLSPVLEGTQDLLCARRPWDQPDCVDSAPAACFNRVYFTCRFRLQCPRIHEAS